MKSRLPWIALVIASIGLGGCREEERAPPVPLTVLASASLEEFAIEVGQAFEQSANVTVQVVTGGTHELAAQLRSGAPADLFLATGLETMDALEAEGLVVAATRWNGVGNRLVVLGREEVDYPAVRFVDAANLGFQRLVVPDPNQDPAGAYARRWLSSVGGRGGSLWNELADRIETVDNIHRVTEAINADPSTAGVVFVTDIAEVSHGKVLFRSPDLGIRYSFALVAGDRPPEAQGLLDFIEGPSGIDLLQMNGFLVEAY
ncbi:MAG: molybdate ABC transporter substrate-binding protein [Thermoanaerobaculia bacterium]|nr:molybdate ABC transporter substrate-binding protein [Thermoanaerobaculia bacterium]